MCHLFTGDAAFCIHDPVWPWLQPDEIDNIEVILQISYCTNRYLLYYAFCLLRSFIEAYLA